MTKKELDEYHEKNAMTVADLIEHLQKNFKMTDKLCFWYEGGAYMNCERVPRHFLNDKRMFVYVKDDKQKQLESGQFSKKTVDEEYQYVKDNDVVIF